MAKDFVYRLKTPYKLKTLYKVLVIMRWEYFGDGYGDGVGCCVLDRLGSWYSPLHCTDKVNKPYDYESVWP
jgi:hypothetical protein